MTVEQTRAELAKIKAAIVTQEDLRGVLPDQQVDATLATLNQKKAELEAALPDDDTASGSVKVENSTVGGSIVTGRVTAQGDFVGRDKTTIGDARGAIVNIGSKLDNVQQTIGAIPHADEATKKELSQLMQQLQAELEKAPVEKAEAVEAVAEAAKDLVEKSAVAKPNKTSVQISGEGLKKAAENLAAVIPTVLKIAGQIVAAIGVFV
ncbi:MAG: hypothetical protein GY943_23755 [Chloroflexi bacterium]|nr:hypothetical protein [Chloroflexota bacterium]